MATTVSTTSTIRTSRLRKYSGAVHQHATHEILSDTPPELVCPVQDLYLRVMIQYARLANSHQRRDSFLTTFDTWCTEHKKRQYLLFWMCVERFQNLEWKPVQRLCSVPMTVQTSAPHIVSDFLTPKSEYSICSQFPSDCAAICEASPSIGMFRTIQSKVFNEVLLPDFRLFWDAHPTMHTSIESSERATDGEVVMACNLFLNEYYDFGSDEECSVGSEPSTLTSQGGWRCVVRQMCASPNF